MTALPREKSLLMSSVRLACLSLLTVILALAGNVDAADDVPKTVAALFADFDPRSEPLDARVVREWEKDGIVFRYVTYRIGTFKGTTARMAAFYGFPKGAQRSCRGCCTCTAADSGPSCTRSSSTPGGATPACRSTGAAGKWKGRQPGDPNTDWGAVDPTQRNVPGYFNLQPGPKYLDPVESPRNNNWYLLTLAARRGLTFLEQQPEVDPDRLGVYGHSMGGNLTVYVAGTRRPGEGRRPVGRRVGLPHLPLAALAPTEKANAQRRRGAVPGDHWASSRMPRTSRHRCSGSGRPTTSTGSWTTPTEPAS